jgi:hypothetical protein
MKLRLSLILFLALGMTAADHNMASGRSETQPFSLTLNAPETVETNARLVVNVLLTNTSDKDIVVLQCGFTDYTVELEGFGTAKGSETELGRRLNHKLLGRVCMATRRVLGPKEAFSDEIAIDKLYRMDSPGRYVIRVQRDLSSWMGSKRTIESNSVTVTVTS